MQSITTKYHGATNTRGARISATASGKAGRVYLPYPHELSGEACHRAAMLALAQKLGWHGTWHGGSANNGAGYVYVYADTDCTFAVVPA